jgi:hypothetical protein
LANSALRINYKLKLKNMGNSAPQIDPKELAKQNKRMISKSIRTVEREQKKLIG